MLWLSLSVALGAALVAPTRVDAVRVEGLWFSTEATVLRELPFGVGEQVTPAQWQLFETRLWNLGIFSQVELRLSPENGQMVAVVKIEDRFPVSPILRANFGGGQFFLWAGVTEVNLFGRAIEGRAFYERFGSQNGFHVHLLDPRLFNRRIAGTIEVESLAQPLPELTVRRGAVRLAFETNAPGVTDDLFRIGVKLEGNSDEITAVSPHAVSLSSKAIVIGPYVRVGRIDTDRLRLRNGFIEVHADSASSSDPLYPFAERLTLEAQWFWELGARFNLGTRVLSGLEVGARPQDRFYIGGLDKVRGYVYSEIRAQKYATANLELRFIAFDSMWFAAMPIAFVDGGMAQRDTGEGQPLASVGAGLRLMVPRLPRFGIRFEVAFPLVGTRQTDVGRPGINFGAWHYF